MTCPVKVGAVLPLRPDDINLIRDYYIHDIEPYRKMLYEYAIRVNTPTGIVVDGVLTVSAGIDSDFETKMKAEIKKIQDEYAAKYHPHIQFY